MKFIKIVLALIVISVSMVAQPVLAADNPYSAIDLGTLGGMYSVAYSINNRGEVIGHSLTENPKVKSLL